MKQIVYQELKSEHADKYSEPKLHLWARMITSNLYDNLDNLAAFCGTTSKKIQSIFSDAIGGAYTWFLQDQQLCGSCQLCEGLIPRVHLFGDKSRNLDAYFCALINTSSH